MPAEPSRAVFLSYASQDVEAALRLAQALRAAGVEVWFDQNELVGGDAWDAKIRKQISECALFVPIISVTTQARREGYFRIEWRLAAQRTHAMADGTPFLLPVVVDDTRDAEALVPPEFKAVQWTRLPDGEKSEAFCGRVQALLGGSAVLQPALAAPERGLKHRATPLPAPSSRPSWVGGALAALVVLVAAGGWLWLRRPASIPAAATKRAASSTTVVAPAAAPLSEARKLAQQAMLLLEDPNFTRDTSLLADELCEKALKLDLSDAEVWAAASFASFNLNSNTYDTSIARRDKIRSQAERALQLDPTSVRAALAVARYQERFGEHAEGIRLMRELHERAPTDQLVIFSLIRAERMDENDEAVAQLFKQLRSLPRTGVLALALWFDAVELRAQTRFGDAGRILDEILAGPVVVRGAYYEKLNLLMRSWHDLAEVEAFIAKIPTRFQQEPAFASAISFQWLWRGEPDKALLALAQLPLDYFEEYAAREPKGYHTGWANQMAGRTVAAQAEWRSALAVVEERLRTDSRNFHLLNQRALLLALTGQPAAARDAWQLRIELGGSRVPPTWESEAQVWLALGENERAIEAITRSFAALGPGSRAWSLPQLRFHPAYAPLRSDARIHRIITDNETWLRELKQQQTGATQPTGNTPQPPDKSVAVLAFANLSDDKANEYFSDGISEELLNVLAKIPALKVSARTSAFSFKGRNVPIPEIARQLGVAYVVEGSVRKAGNQVRITAQLIKAADGFHVWSENFNRELKDIFAVQDEIAALIAKNLSLKLGTAAVAATVNPEAYRLYLEGRAAWNRRDAAGFREAEQLLNQAIELEPRLAKAYAALADVWTVRAFPLSGSFGQRQSPVLARTIAKATQAVALDDNSAEAHASLGHSLGQAWRFAESLRELRRAIELNPNYASAHQWLGRVLLMQGQLDEGLAALGRATELDPLSHRILDNYSDALANAGRLDEAWAVLGRARALQPMGVQIRCKQALLLVRLGRRDDAIAAARALVADAAAEEPDYRLSTAASVYATCGETAEAEALLHRITLDSEDRPIAVAYTGRIKEFLPHLDDLTVNWINYLWFDPAFASIRAEPAFREWTRKVGLAEVLARAEAWTAAHPPATVEATK